MSKGKTDIFVYAHWYGMQEPRFIGTLSALKAKGKKAFSFAYDEDWINSSEQLHLDPDIQWYTGPQYPVGKENFGMFLDSMPDRWGRTLMKRRAILDAEKPSRKLYDIDFLLGVYDESRMGALRFKLDPDGPFLNDNKNIPIPPWSSTRELQFGAKAIESDDAGVELDKWLKILVAPGSSLGGARPKANILDDFGHPWIAKFPSKNDQFDKAAWEFLAYKLALKAKIKMSDSRLEKVAGKYHTFFTKRFDRFKGERIHFASAMTLTGNDEASVRDDAPSYLELAEFIQFSGANVQQDLHELWRRIVFNIAISNTDDHLRNHGFLLTKKGWVLSPVFDVNPSVEKDHLSLNIDMEDGSLNFELAKSVGIYFQLDNAQMNKIIKKVKSVVQQWEAVAKAIGISRKEQVLMGDAFRG